MILSTNNNTIVKTERPKRYGVIKYNINCLKMATYLLLLIVAIMIIVKYRSYFFDCGLVTYFKTL